MPHAPIQSVHVNRKALWDYESLTSYEAGIILTGSEVKALRDGSVNLRSAWIALASGRPQIIGMHIGRYQHSSEVARDDGKRPRDILMKKKDIAYLGWKTREKGLALIPTEVYFRGGLAKIKVVLARGRKQYDKKALLKERDLDRESRKAVE